MSPEEARYIIAHEVGLHLRKYGVPPTEIEKVLSLRPAGARLVQGKPMRVRARMESNGQSVGAVEVDREEERPMTPAAIFDSRTFHQAVGKSSKRLFVNRHYSDAIRSGFQAVNNRARQLSGSTAEDGQALMGDIFKENSPELQMTDLSTVPEKDEQAGLKLVAMGSMRGLRNPRSHSDEEWWTDREIPFVLDCLALASLLHRCLDHCQNHMKASKG